jgi:hypothetical protein
MENQKTGKICTRKVCLLSVLCFFSLFSCLYARPVISNYSGDFVFNYKISEKHGNIKVYYYAPQRLTQTSRIVFVLHGDNRKGAAYRDVWKQYAESYNFLVICPELSDAEFPYSKYNLGNVYDEEKKKFNSREQWTFNIIEQLFDFVKEDRQIKVSTYCIYGHSSGAQFVQRMVLFMPEARFSTAIANGAGWYTLPSFDYEFDLGIKHSPVSEETLKKAFGKQLIILMGEKDFVSKIRPKSYAETTHQFDRLWRAMFFYEEAKSKSKELGVELNWIFKLVPDADHNDPPNFWVASALAAKSAKNIKDPNDTGNEIRK